MGVNIYITGFDVDKQLVSGTKVDFAFYVNAGVAVLWDPPQPPPTGVHPYNRVKITSVTMSIGGTLVYNEPGTSDPGAVDSVWKAVRYASTQFSDKSEIDLELNATVELSYVPDGQPGIPPPSPYTLACTPLKIKNIAHNKMEVMATKNSVPVDLSKSIAEMAGIMFLDSHKITPNWGNDPWRTKAQLANDLKESTFTFFSTHGSLSIYQDSDGDDVTYSENNTYLFSNRAASTPWMNMAVMYACTTLNSSYIPWPISFGVHWVWGALVNKAYAGFDAECLPGWEDPDGKNISLWSHAYEFADKIKGGGTIAQAVAHANQATFVIEGHEMEFRGDSYARIMNVYLNASEREGLSQGEIDNWYIVF